MLKSFPMSLPLSNSLPFARKVTQTALANLQKTADFLHLIHVSLLLALKLFNI